MSAVSHMALLGRGSSFPPKLDVDQIPTMTAATTSGVTISTSSDFSASFAGWKAGANDGSTSRWETASTATGWLKVDFGSPTYIYSYTVLGPNSTVKPTAWTFEGSDTGAFAGEQVALDTQSSQNPITVTVYTLAAGPKFYRYYRWNITANGGSVDTGLDEIELRQ